MRVTITPPWDDATVAALNRFQHASGVHPFTCGRDACSQPLVATRDGWRCPTLDGYEQGWAHAFMADPTTWPATTPVATPGKHGPAPLPPPPLVTPAPPVITHGTAVIKP